MQFPFCSIPLQYLQLVCLIPQSFIHQFSLSSESLHSASSVSLRRDHQLPHLFSVFLCPLLSASSFRHSRYAASSSCFSLKCSYIFLVSITPKVSPVSLGLYVHFSPYLLSLMPFFCLHLPNTSSFSFFVHLSRRASLSSENRCDKLTLELFTCQADD